MLNSIIYYRKPFYSSLQLFLSCNRQQHCRHQKICTTYMQIRMRNHFTSRIYFQKEYFAFIFITKTICTDKKVSFLKFLKSLRWIHLKSSLEVIIARKFPTEIKRYSSKTDMWNPVITNSQWTLTWKFTRLNFSEMDCTKFVLSLNILNISLYWTN